ncbi:toxin-antitoxin system HicB family antitoxin [Castellaniella ginsengisoli]|uniref:Type II toxin-antitoxin system HicB family antitoxin n=1 Tax=Castellaniella ginsengisoli TaxID=546114 RepID=A0AB39DB41_9BURK
MGEHSLTIFLDECKRRGIEPRKQFSGKFVLRVSPAIHEAATLAAAAHGKSLNQWVSKVLHDTLEPMPRTAA